MYSFYKIFGKFSKLFSNILIILAIPLSIIMAGVGWALFSVENILYAIGAKDLIDPVTGNEMLLEVVPIVKWVGLGVGIFFTVAIAVLIISWVLKKILFKKIADNYITRNKEWRNRDINRTIEKLETYRFRD